MARGVTPRQPARSGRQDRVSRPVAAKPGKISGGAGSSRTAAGSRISGKIERVKAAKKTSGLQSY